MTSFFLTPNILGDKHLGLKLAASTVIPSSIIQRGTDIAHISVLAFSFGQYFTLVYDLRLGPGGIGQTVSLKRRACIGPEASARPGCA